MKKALQILAVSVVGILNAQVGIGTETPTNTLHVVRQGTQDPVRIEGLLPAENTAGTLITDPSGVVKLRNRNSISSVSINGNITYALNATYYNTNVSATPIETYDNLNEFAGNTFTAAQNGLYMASLDISIVQQSSAQTGGDGLLGYARIQKNGLDLINSTKKIAIPEATGAPALSNVEAFTLVKLNAGETLSFSSSIYGGANNAKGSYSISISRID